MRAEMVTVNNVVVRVSKCEKGKCVMKLRRSNDNFRKCGTRCQKIPPGKISYIKYHVML